MPKLQAIAFFEEISKNKQLAQEVEKIVGGKNSDEVKTKELLSLAKKHNFNFTQAEAASVQGALKTSLSPEEMLEVSGGKIGIKSSLMAAAMLLGLGVGGTTLYSVNTNANGPGGYKQMEIQNDDSDTETEDDDSKTISMEEVVEPKQRENTLTTRTQKQRKDKEISREAANRYPKWLRVSKDLLSNIRAQAFRAALPSASWPKIENPSSTPGVSNCRHCGSPLYIHSTKKHTECRCTDDGCIDNWCFRKMANEKGLKNSQRGDRAKDFSAHCRLSLLPALILDSRLPNSGLRGNTQRSTNTPLVCGAEYWATAQLIIGNLNNWPTSPRLTHDKPTQDMVRQVNEVKRLLEDAYNRLTKEEMMQLIDGHNSNWTELKEQFKKDITNAEKLKSQDKQKGRLPKEVPEKTDKEIQDTVDRLVALLEEAYKCITDDKLKSVGIDPGIAPNRIPSMSPLSNTTTAMDEETFNQPSSTTPLMKQTPMNSSNTNSMINPNNMSNQMPHHQPEIPQHPQNFLNTNSMINNNNIMNQMQPQQQMMKHHQMNQMWQQHPGIPKLPKNFLNTNSMLNNNNMMNKTRQHHPGILQLPQNFLNTNSMINNNNIMNQMRQQQTMKPKAILKQQMPHHQPEISQHPKSFSNTNSMSNLNNMMNQMQPQQQMTKLSNLNNMMNQMRQHHSGIPQHPQNFSNTNQMRQHHPGIPQHPQNFSNTNQMWQHHPGIPQFPQNFSNMNQMQPQQQNPITAKEPRERQEYIRRSIVKDVKQYFSKPNPIADLDKEYKQNPKKVAIDLQSAVNELINLPKDDFHKEMIAVRQDQNGKISPSDADYLFRKFEDDVLQYSSSGRFLDLEFRLFYGPDGILYGEPQFFSGCVGRTQHMAVVAVLNDIKNQLLEHIDSDKEKQKFEAEITKRINEIDERFNTILSWQGKLNLSGDPARDDILLHYNNVKTYKPTIDTP